MSFWRFMSLKPQPRSLQGMPINIYEYTLPWLLHWGFMKASSVIFFWDIFFLGGRYTSNIRRQSFLMVFWALKFKRKNRAHDQRKGNFQKGKQSQKATQVFFNHKQIRQFSAQHFISLQFRYHFFFVGSVPLFSFLIVSSTPPKLRLSFLRVFHRFFRSNEPWLTTIIQVLRRDLWHTLLGCFPEILRNADV